MDPKKKKKSQQPSMNPSSWKIFACVKLMPPDDCLRVGFEKILPEQGGFLGGEKEHLTPLDPLSFHRLQSNANLAVFVWSDHTFTLSCENLIIILFYCLRVLSFIYIFFNWLPPKTQRHRDPSLDWFEKKKMSFKKLLSKRIKHQIV